MGWPNTILVCWMSKSLNTKRLMVLWPVLLLSVYWLLDMQLLEELTPPKPLLKMDSTMDIDLRVRLETLLESLSYSPLSLIFPGLFQSLSLDLSLLESNGVILMLE